MREVGLNVQRIIQWEITHNNKSWTTDDIKDIADTTLVKLLRKRKLIYRDRDHNGRVPRFHTTEKAVEQYGEQKLKLEEQEEGGGEENVIPDDLLDGIVGLEDVKELIMMVVTAPQPAHMYMWGGPGSAKSAILYSLERLPNSEMIDSTMATKTGIAEFLLQTDPPPKYLIVDELDKLDGNGYDALLTLMSDGRIVKTKSRGKNARVDVDMPVYVIGAGNSIARIPDTIRSRFSPYLLRLGSYGRKKSLDMMEGILREKSINPSLAPYIANKLVTGLDERDPRAALQLARTCRTKEQVDKALKTLDKYK